MSTTDVGSHRCASELMDTIPSIMRFIRNQVKSHAGSSASLPQIRILGFLRQNPGASLSKAAEHLGVSNATASAIVERLVQKGLVERTEHPEERRFVVLKLTPEGSRQFQALHLYASSQLSEALADLPAQKVAKVIEAMNILKEIFDESK